MCRACTQEGEVICICHTVPRCQARMGMKQNGNAWLALPACPAPEGMVALAITQNTPPLPPRYRTVHPEEWLNSTRINSKSQSSCTCLLATLTSTQWSNTRGTPWHLGPPPGCSLPPGFQTGQNAVGILKRMLQARFQIEWHLLVVIVLRVHCPQQTPGLHVARLPLHLGLEGQDSLGEQAVPEELLPPGKAVQVLGGAAASIRGTACCPQAQNWASHDSLG